MGVATLAQDRYFFENAFHSLATPALLGVAVAGVDHLEVHAKFS